MDEKSDPLLDEIESVDWRNSVVGYGIMVVMGATYATLWLMHYDMIMMVGTGFHDGQDVTFFAEEETIDEDMSYSIYLTPSGGWKPGESSWETIVKLKSQSILLGTAVGDDINQTEAFEEIHRRHYPSVTTVPHSLCTETLGWYDGMTIGVGYHFGQSVMFLAEETLSNRDTLYSIRPFIGVDHHPEIFTGATDNGYNDFISNIAPIGYIKGLDLPIEG